MNEQSNGLLVLLGGSMKWQPEAGSVGGHLAPIRFSCRLDPIKELTSLLGGVLRFNHIREDRNRSDRSIVNQSVQAKD